MDVCVSGWYVSALNGALRLCEVCWVICRYAGIVDFPLFSGQDFSRFFLQ